MKLLGKIKKIFKKKKTIKTEEIDNSQSISNNNIFGNTTINGRIYPNSIISDPFDYSLIENPYYKEFHDGFMKALEEDGLKFIPYDASLEMLHKYFDEVSEDDCEDYFESGKAYAQLYIEAKKETTWKLDINPPFYPNQTLWAHPVQIPNSWLNQVQVKVQPPSPSDPLHVGLGGIKIGVGDTVDYD